jgi:hypothetical protein
MHATLYPKAPLKACCLATMATLPLLIQRHTKSLYKSTERLILDSKRASEERKYIDGGKRNGLNITGIMVSLKDLMFAINEVVHVGNIYIRFHTGLPGCLNSCCNRFYGH